jgi:ACS family hexuronate transporter-like MFS transporter
MGTVSISFVLYGAPLYFGRGLGASQAQIGRVLWIPPLGWELGFLFWGWVMDRITVRAGSLSVFRRSFAVLAVLSLPLALVPWLGTLMAVLMVLFLAMFVVGGFTIINLAYGTKTFPLASSGLMAGLGTGTASALVAISMPFFGRLFDRHRYDMAFAVAACAPLVGFVFWWMLNKIRDSGHGNPG